MPNPRGFENSISSSGLILCASKAGLNGKSENCAWKSGKDESWGLGGIKEDAPVRKCPVCPWCQAACPAGCPWGWKFSGILSGSGISSIAAIIPGTAGLLKPMVSILLSSRLMWAASGTLPPFSGSVSSLNSATSAVCSGLLLP